MTTARVLGLLGRAGLLGAALLVTTATSSTQRPSQYTPPSSSRQFQPPAPEPMDANQALGLYRTSFGPVKLEATEDGLPSVHGVWVYDRNGEEVIGYFSGSLNGNVLEFSWQEPADPEPLRGEGFLVFHSDGTGFFGKWWTEDRSRSGDWTGQKHQVEDDAPTGPAEPAPIDDGYPNGAAAPVDI